MSQLTPAAVVYQLAAQAHSSPAITRFDAGLRVSWAEAHFAADMLASNSHRILIAGLPQEKLTLLGYYVITRAVVWPADLPQPQRGVDWPEWQVNP